MKNPAKVLIIQTASIGDVILATPLIESLKLNFPDANIDFLLKKGNESIFSGHPLLHQVIAWEKKEGKYRNLFNIISMVRRSRYDLVINLQRFASTGLITLLSGAAQTVGFDKNPLSRFFTQRVRHLIYDGQHEADRNIALLTRLNWPVVRTVKIYPSKEDEFAVKPFQTSEYICVAPASLWFTKQYPEEKWVDFIKKVPPDIKVCLVGSANDHELCERILLHSGRNMIENLAGRLSLLQTAALMQGARMNYVNDSAPQHLASATDAPVTAIFCSTLPAFGFGPLSKNSAVIETNQKLQCRPCGLHGLRQCPESHFNCAMTIDTQELLNRL